MGAAKHRCIVQRVRGSAFVHSAWELSSPTRACSLSVSSSRFLQLGNNAMPQDGTGAPCAISRQDLSPSLPPSLPLSLSSLSLFPPCHPATHRLSRLPTDPFPPRPNTNTHAPAHPLRIHTLKGSISHKRIAWLFCLRVKWRRPLCSRRRDPKIGPTYTRARTQARAHARERGRPRTRAHAHTLERTHE